MRSFIQYGPLHKRYSEDVSQQQWKVNSTSAWLPAAEVKEHRTGIFSTSGSSEWLGLAWNAFPLFLMLNNGAFCMLGRCEVDKPSRAAVLRDQGTPGFKWGEKKQRSSPLQSREALRSELNYQLQAELHLETTGLLLKIRGANKLPAHSRSSAREAEKKGVVLSNSYFPVSL